MVFTTDELREMGITVGNENVSIDRSVRFFGADRMVFDGDLRIDGFCSLSAGSEGIQIGRHVHIARFVDLSGIGIRIGNYCGISSQVSIFSSSDSYSSGALTNPMVPEKYRDVNEGVVTLCDHVIIGSGSVIMPRVRLGLASSVGALSLVNKSVPDFAIVSGIPVKRIGRRSEAILERQKAFELERDTEI